ncbi:PREDICTED: GSK-3-binding protein FRAT2 [Elephantulus edwardii]|uniref:GSK-3-binding protein FRAT2 n=1 Tax=Elephantulus edwardii TaxID=28737 RepID=UPI0003F0ED6B|nr:PREDICTED: GSK-3-binding protein FRAT2 [Elephantulus edwardii]
MRCRREEEERAEGEEEEDSFLLLEQSVTLGGSGEVDQLVAQIGKALQLDASQDRSASQCAPPGPPLQPPRPLPAVPADKARPRAQPVFLSPVLPSSTEAASPSSLRCTLGELRRVRVRAAPYCVAELTADSGALPGPYRRGWLRGAAPSRRLHQRRWPQAGAGASDADLLQQLVLSGNLIKEAVRRIQPAVAVVFPVAATGPTGTSGSGGGLSGPDAFALQPSGALH